MVQAQGQDVQNERELLDMEEFTFSPSIINVKGVTSNMGDYMRSWSDKRELHLQESRSERFLIERQDFPFRPELPARSMNEELLRCSGYAGPIQAWRKHAEHYMQLRKNDPEASVEHAKDRIKVGSQTPWSDVVQRLYPFSNANAESPQGSFSPVLSKAASPDTSKPFVKAKDLQAEDGASPIAVAAPDESSGASGMQGQRRCGRPPKATWQFLYESGTRQLRGKSMPPRVENNATPTPLPRSQQLLKRDSSARRPLYQKSAQNPPEHATQPEKSSAGPSSRSERARSSRDHNVNAGQRLYEQSERQKSLQEQRQHLASELKIAEEMRECTFQPHIERVSCDRRIYKSFPSETPPVDETSLSLYERGLRLRQRRQQMEESGVQKRTEAELRECTFQPNVHRKKCLARDTSFASQPSPSACSASMCQEDVCIEADVTQSSDISVKVLTMLEDWRVRCASQNVGRVVHSSHEHGKHVDEKPHALDENLRRRDLPNQPKPHALDENLRRRDSPKQAKPHTFDESLRRKDSPDQSRHEDLSSEVHVLLENWRGGWGTSSALQNHR